MNIKMVRKFTLLIFYFTLFSINLLNITNCGILESKKTIEYEQIISPPIAKIIPKFDTLYGDIRVDNYFWLRDRKNPEVIEYLRSENEYTKAMMKHTEKFQEQLYKELLGRIKEEDIDVPVKIDDYYYYKRTEKGKEYEIFCRKEGSLDAVEEILLDQNELAGDHDYLDVYEIRVSPDHSLLAYSVDTTGNEIYTIYIKDLSNGKLRKDEILNSDGNIIWANDNITLFYTTLDEINRPFKVYRHVLETEQDKDQMVYHEKDDAFFIYLFKTKSKKYIIMQLLSKITTENHFLSADNPLESFNLIQPRIHGIEYYVDNHDDKFYIMTNDQAKNFKLMEVSIENPLRENWNEVIPHHDSVKIDDFELFNNYLIVYERKRGLKEIRIMDLNSNKFHYINFPEPVYNFRKGENPNFYSNTLRFIYESLITPKSVYDYNMDTKEQILLKQYEVVGGYKPNIYQSERIFATAKDGVKIPISIAYKKGLLKDSNNPMYLTGYGAYGSSSDAYFSSIRLSLLERDFIYAITHVRGGGEMGREWYEQGKFLNKKNTFTDFISCAEYLISEGYTSPDNLAITGGSAGGLLIGAVTNMRPDLFKVVIADFPFVDALNTMLDPTIPLTILEYDEWGNPEEKEYYFYIKSYSPYDNVEVKDYPNMLITAGLNDPRVQYWEPAKWAAKLRALKTDDNILLLKTNMGTGHFGVSGRYDYLKEIAFEYAFIFDIFGK